MGRSPSGFPGGVPPDFPTHQEGGPPVLPSPTARQKHQKPGRLALTTVEGIGPTRAKALFQYFKTKKAMTERPQWNSCTR